MMLQSLVISAILQTKSRRSPTIADYVQGRPQGDATDAAALGTAPLRPRSMVFRQVVHFFQIHLALENSVETAYKSHC